MGKQAVQGWIDEEAKAGIVLAVRPILGSGGSLAGLLQKFGEACVAEIARLKKETRGEVRDGEYELVIRLEKKRTG